MRIQGSTDIPMDCKTPTEAFEITKLIFDTASVVLYHGPDDICLRSIFSRFNASVKGVIYCGR